MIFLFYLYFFYFYFNTDIDIFYFLSLSLFVSLSLSLSLSTDQTIPTSLSFSFSFSLSLMAGQCQKDKTGKSLYNRENAGELKDENIILQYNYCKVLVALLYNTVIETGKKKSHCGVLYNE